ncbi:hypothetical protein LTR72_008165 [Exophiala xenobiotica]|nr:hypothetical protein LTR72_008165 [Exophiala xenobiotica]KAK5291316.1 hypothetical protein LTR14_005890 [Exophiala xenobiotica]KAK5482013.1 hypothetical protein LTR55_006894 [Exophiala xenobiotica]
MNQRTAGPRIEPSSRLSQVSDISHEFDESTPRKRRKIALACNQCRARKTRCDGVKPVCGECSQRVVNRSDPSPCRYKKAQTDPEKEEYVRNLHLRIQQLESQLKTSEPGDAGQPARLTMTPDSNNAAHHVFANAATQPPAPGPTHAQFQEEEVSPVDAMGANSTIEPADQGHDSRYYGSSSTVSFMQQVYSTVLNDGASSNSASWSGNPPRQNAGSNRDKFWAPQGLEQLSLLPRPLMDRALNCYWDRIYHLYPFIHKPTFMCAYEQLWQANPSETELNTPEAGLGGSVEYGPHSTVFHCALNVMLALAMQFMDTPLDDRRRLEDLFAKRARDLCHLDLLDDGSLAVIQTLLIMTQYLQSTPFPNRCWNCIGITCRLAQGLGLYVESPHAMKRMSPLEVEMRRRVWYGCVTLDAVVSMTLGRPLMLSNSNHIPLPQAVDDEYLSSPDSQPAGHVSWVDFFVQTIKLYSMLADVVSQMYTTSPSRPIEASRNSYKHIGFDSFAFIQEMDTEISAFEDGIPDQIHWERRQRLPMHIKAVKVFEIQASVLLSRFLHLHILLYRPALSRFCQQVCARDVSKSSTYQGTRTRQSDVSMIVARGLTMACVDNSIRLIEQVYLRSTTAATGAWWYNLYYARTAGIVVLLALICDDIIESAGWATLTESWNKCKSTLSALQVFSPTAASCLRGMEKLHQHILTYKHKQDFDASMNHAVDLDVSTTPRVREESLIPQPGTAVNGDPFEDLGNLDWPNDLEASMLDDIFSFDFANMNASI